MPTQSTGLAAAIHTAERRDINKAQAQYATLVLSIASRDPSDGIPGKDVETIRDLCEELNLQHEEMYQDIDRLRQIHEGQSMRQTLRETVSQLPTAEELRTQIKQHDERVLPRIRELHAPKVTMMSQLAKHKQVLEDVTAQNEGIKLTYSRLSPSVRAIFTDEALKG